MNGLMLAWTRYLAAVILAAMAPLQAYVVPLNPEGQPLRWWLDPPHPLVSANIVNPHTRAIRYFIGAEAYSSANRVAELNAVRASFDQWQAIPGTSLKFEEGGLIEGEVDVNTQDGTNVVFWARNSTIVNGGWDDIRGATGVTFFEHYSDNALAEADIVLNGHPWDGFRWFTDFEQTSHAANEYFVESVLLHEIGHFIGLNHSPLGGATMFARGDPGVNLQAGLSLDELSAARELYPSSGHYQGYGRIRGKVLINGEPVFGAMVVVEDSAGNALAGTVSRSDGAYELPALDPGAYQVRAAPLQANYSNVFLSRGSPLVGVWDISPSFALAQTGFMPSSNKTATVLAGTTTVVDFVVQEGSPSFHIMRIRPAVENPNLRVVSNAPTWVRPGQSNIYVGVYAPEFPPGAALSITGDGIAAGETLPHPKAFTHPNGDALDLLSLRIDVSPAATPGLRSFVVQHGGDTAWANGFLEVKPLIPDFNFDGLDDRFQRKYFPLFTSPEAAPGADPDGDGFSNHAEFLSGTDPTDPASFLELESARHDADGTLLTWKSAPGKRYQVWSRLEWHGIRGWQKRGPVLTASGEKTSYLDENSSLLQRFYRIEAVP
jgi:hypothetical protein